MARRVQAGHGNSRQRRRAGNAARLCVCLLLSGCAGGPDNGRPAADTSLTTGAVTRATAPPLAGEMASDEIAVREAVSAADPEKLAHGTLAWSNPRTGSRGVITGLAEYREDDAPCRRFLTTREAFDGVALHAGAACLEAAGTWRMRTFRKL